jgi:hypothetical protein
MPSDQASKVSSLDKGLPVSEHKSAPFIWLECGGADGAGKTMDAKGGRDKFAQWAGQEFPDVESIQVLASTETPPLSEAFFDNDTPGGTWMQEQTSELENAS